MEYIYRNKDRIPIDFVLIDDGWTKYGDWDKWNEKRFPQGPKWLSTEIKKRGFKFGLWFAPFLVGTDSVLFKEHQDWLVKDKNGKLVVGYRLLPFDVGPVKYILDGQNEEAIEYLFSVVDRFVNDWGVGLIKCDFLYAPYFDPKLTSSEIPNGIVRRLLGYIRSNYPEVATVASGPVAQMVDLVDATYFAENTFSPPLDGIWPLNVLHHSFRLHQVEKAFRLREGIKKLFNLDPDVFACRDSIGLAASQIERLFNLIKKTNGDIFLGDDLTKLPDWKIDKYITPLLKKQ